MKSGSENALRFLLFTVAVLYGLSFWTRPPIDPDLGWHLLGGQWISAHGAVPKADFINTFNLFWHDYHWLAQLAIYKVFEAGGYAALQIGLGIISALICTVIVLLCLSGSGKPGIGTVVIAAVVCILLHRIGLVRPQMFSFLLLGVSQLILVKKKVHFELLLLILAAVVLVNIHVYWVFIPLLWFFYRCVPRFFRKNTFSPLYSWGGLLLIGLAGFVSPYGIFDRSINSPGPLANYLLLFEYAATPGVLKSRVTEFQGSVFGQGVSSAILFISVAVFARSFRLKRALSNVGDFLSALTGFLLAASAVKFLPVFGILGCRYFSLALRGTASSRNNKKRKSVNAGASIFLSLVSLLFLYQGVTGFPHGGSAWEKDAAAFIPFGACRKAARVPIKPGQGRDHVRMLTYFEQGGWCSWLINRENPSANIKITTDNRTQWVPGRHYEMSFDLYHGQFDWWQTLQSWDPDLALVPTSGALYSLLSLMPGGWSLEYEDENFSLFSKKQ